MDGYPITPRPPGTEAAAPMPIGPREGGSGPRHSGVSTSRRNVPPGSPHQRVGRRRRPLERHLHLVDERLAARRGPREDAARLLEDDALGLVLVRPEDPDRALVPVVHHAAIGGHRPPWSLRSGKARVDREVDAEHVLLRLLAARVEPHHQTLAAQSASPAPGRASSGTDRARLASFWRPIEKRCFSTGSGQAVPVLGVAVDANRLARHVDVHCGSAARRSPGTRRKQRRRAKIVKDASRARTAAGRRRARHGTSNDAGRHSRNEQ